MANAVCSGKIVMNFKSELHVEDNPLGLEGAIAIGRMLSSTYCKLKKANLSKCQLTIVEGFDTSPLSHDDKVPSGDARHKLCLMPQLHHYMAYPG